MTKMYRICHKLTNQIGARYISPYTVTYEQGQIEIARYNKTSGKNDYWYLDEAK